MAIAAVIDEGRLQRRLDPRYLGKIDVSSKLLAVRRSGVTVALHMLEARKMIRSRRNLVEILDYDSLVQAAGEEALNRTEPDALPSR